MLSPASPWCWMVPSPTASRTAPSGVSSKRPANAPSEKRVGNLFTTVGGTRSNACSSTGGGGVCAEQSSAGIAKRRSSKKSVFRQSTPNCLTLEIERFWNSSFPLARMASTSRSLTRPATLSASPLYVSRLSRSRPGVESAGVCFRVSDTSVYLLRRRKAQHIIADVWRSLPHPTVFTWLWPAHLLLECSRRHQKCLIHQPDLAVPNRCHASFGC